MERAVLSPIFALQALRTHFRVSEDFVAGIVHSENRNCVFDQFHYSSMLPDVTAVSFLNTIRDAVVLTESQGSRKYNFWRTVGTAD